MKSRILKTAMIAAVVMAATATQALADDGTVDADIGATAVIDRYDISVTEYNQIDFGSVIMGTTAGTVVLSATNAPDYFVAADDATTGTSTDYTDFADATAATVVASSGLTASGTPTAGIYSVYSTDAASAQGLDYSITLPSQIDMTVGFGAGAGTQTMSVTNLTFASSSAAADPANQTLPAAYATNEGDAIQLGGTLNIAEIGRASCRERV